MRPSTKAQSKATRIYVQSGQYLLCGESCSSNLVSDPYPKLSRANRWINPQMSNKELHKKKESTLLKGLVKND